MSERDWPKDTVGWFDESGNAWCRDHEPETHEGKLTPVLESDDWLWELGICAREECSNLIADPD